MIPLELKDRLDHATPETLSHLVANLTSPSSSADIAEVLLDLLKERLESARNLRHAELELQQAQKMETVGRLAGGIAHDFNNLLTAITGHCDLLLEEIGTQHPARTDAEEILRASERAAGLTRQLLTFSRRQVLQPRIVDLNELVAEMDRMLRRMVGDNIEFETRVDGPARLICADPGQLHQVLLNLVVNARDAMPGGGVITIATGQVCVASDISSELGTLPAGNYFVMSVADRGHGMDDETQSRIFEPFFTTKESGKGTGLGLSTVLGIMQRSGGHIRLQSRLGRGSKFTLYFPPSRAEVASTPERRLVLGDLTGSETILLVEDAETVRKLVARHLERQGYDALVAASGEEALGICRSHPGRIHLLLSDIILPGMDGLETARELQKLRPETPAIFMSGSSGDALVTRGFEPDRMTVIDKPFTPSTLLQAIRKCLDDAESGHAASLANSPGPGSPSVCI